MYSFRGLSAFANLLKGARKLTDPATVTNLVRFVFYKKQFPLRDGLEDGWHGGKSKTQTVNDKERSFRFQIKELIFFACVTLQLSFSYHLFDLCKFLSRTQWRTLVPWCSKNRKHMMGKKEFSWSTGQKRSSLSLLSPLRLAGLLQSSGGAAPVSSP